MRPSTFQNYLRELADLGVEAWTLLFGTRYGDREGASERLGKLLESIELREGSHVQITYSDTSSPFIFPWSISIRQHSTVEVDPFRFWGARFQIEQVTAGPKAMMRWSTSREVVFGFLDPNFENIDDAPKDIASNVSRCRDGQRQISISAWSETHPAITLSPKALIHDPSAHLIYFYCHGYAAKPAKSNCGPRRQQPERQIKALQADSPARAAFDMSLTLTAKMDDESWIYIGGAEVPQGK